MKGALEQFEASLIAASRKLHTGPPTQVGERRGRGRLRRLRQASVVAQLAFAVTSFSALGGAATGAYLWLSGGSPGTHALASFECAVSNPGGANNAALIVPSITGDPLIDCAAALLQIQGHRPPPLSAWSNGYQTAVVRPAAAGPPRSGGVWRRLPGGWTVDLAVVELNDQLNDISAGMADGTACTYAAHAVRVARSLLLADGLRGWHVALHANNGPLVSGCRHIAATIDARARKVELIQIQALGQAVHVPALQRRRAREYSRALAILLRLQARANQILSANCESVAQATGLWRQEAGDAGFLAATPAFWRELHALGQQAGNGPPALPAGFFMHYTLFRQPAGQRTGACAHLLIQDDGGDQLIVYAARMAP